MIHRDIKAFVQGHVVALTISVVGAAILCAFAWDFGEFVWQCMNDSAQAARGLEQISQPVIDSEAIVVLTGDRTRIPKALELLRARGTPRLIISGAGKHITLTDLVNQQGDSTINIHEIWSKIVLESKSTSTVENASETAKLVETFGISRVVLVTSEYHMNRAVKVFETVLPQIQFLPYSVPSGLAEFSIFEPRKSASIVGKLFLEYAKLIHFEWYQRRRLVRDFGLPDFVR